MIEAYAFHAAFAVQILVFSVLIPNRFVRYSRGWASNFSSERFAQLYSRPEYEKTIERFVTVFRVVTLVIALAGLLMLGWFFNLAPRPDWANAVTKLVACYFMLQASPFVLILIYGFVRHRKLFAQLVRPAQEPKRTATLQRRGLLDFVSPVTVAVAVLSYVLFIPFAIVVDLYVYGNASLSKYCYSAIACVTLVYALNGFIAYKQLYGKKNPLVSVEGRMHTIGMTVKSNVYGSIAIVWFMVLISFATKLQLENWKPFVTTVFVILSVLFGFMGLKMPPRKPEVDEPGPAGQLEQR